MNIDQQTYERIEAFLLNRLDESERQAFEAEMAADPAFAREVTLQKEIFAGLEDAALKDELKILHSQLDAGVGGLSGVWKTGLSILGVIAMGTLIMWLIPDKKPVVVQENLPTDSVAVVIDSVIPESTPQTEASTISEVVVPSPSSPTQTQTQTQTQTEVPEPEIPVKQDTSSQQVTEPEPTIPDPEPVRPMAPQGMLHIEAGRFTMGDANGPLSEQPAHEVQLQAYFIDRQPVSTTQYCAFLNAQDNETIDAKMEKWIPINREIGTAIGHMNGTFFPKRGWESRPMYGVSWEGADAYARWAGKRLPTEAEWEYAAKQKLIRVGRWQEWCGDYFAPYSEDEFHPRGFRSVRTYQFGRPTTRLGVLPTASKGDLSFRCARDLGKE